MTIYEMNSPILNLKLLPVRDFNNIGLPKQQSLAPSAAQLKSIAELFTAHNMHLYYGIGILHRHVELKQGEILLHRMCGEDQDVCTVEQLRSLPMSNPAPHSFLLYRQEQFRAYEHDDCLGRPLPHEKSLYALREFFLADHLERRIAVVPIPAPSSPLCDSVEILLPGNAGMRTVPRSTEHGNLEIFQTCWSFGKDASGNATYAAFKSCVKDKVTGEHVRQR